jgi:PLP dependent protein
VHTSVINFISVKKEMELKISNQTNINIVAVSKTFEISKIIPLIDHGHIHFGENKVQESVNKWKDIKLSNNDIQLHMIGKLQTNKVKQAILHFDYIHSLDNIKLAKKISSEQKKNNRNLKIFIQVNIGHEEQKNGILPSDVKSFYSECLNDLNLDIIGLMCIPPQHGNVEEYFNEMNIINKSLGLKELSMGMSSDYIKAINHGATFLRIGSKIFGSRV